MRKSQKFIIKYIVIAIIAIVAITIGYHCIVCVMGLNMHETVDCRIKVSYHNHKPQISEYCSVN